MDNRYRTNFKAFLDATLRNPVKGLPLQLPDPTIQRDQNQIKADVYVCRNIRMHAEQQGVGDLAYRADVIESALLNDARVYAQPGEQNIKSLDQLSNMLDNSYRNMVRNIGDLIRNSEKRSQCRIFNARINNSRSKFKWLPNDQGIVFGRLPNGDPDLNAVAPDNLDDYRRQVNHDMLNAIVQHYGIGEIPNEELEEKSKRVLTYLGLFLFYYI